MIAYYRITELLKDHLLADNDMNTVKIDDLDEADLNKQTIFPLSLLQVNQAETIEGVIQFNVTVYCMDAVDVTKKDLRDENEQFKGIDNKQDVLNTMLAVLENLETSLRKGTLQESGLELLEPMVKEPFEDRFPNLVTGWSSNFDVMMPNEIQGCGNSYTLGDVTFSNTLITFSNNNGNG